MPLSAAFNTVTGMTPPKRRQELYGDAIPFVKPPELLDCVLDSAGDGLSTEGAGEARILPVGSVLVSCIGNLGKVGLNSVPVAFNQQINAILPCPERAIPKFLFYQAKSPGFQDQLNALASGTTVPIVNKSKFNSIGVALPPLDEQKRIVAILDEAFAEIEAANANVEANVDNAQSLFDSAFGSITGTSRHRGWRVVKVADLASQRKNAIRTGPFGSQLLHSEFVDDGVAVLGIDNVVRNSFTWDKRRFITNAKFEALRRYQAFPGDVMITIMGTCGRCAVVPDNIPQAITSKHICCITLDADRCLPGYLHQYFLHHPVAREYLESQAKGSIMAGLNMAIIKDLPVDVPPVEEQPEILQRLTDIGNLTAGLGAVSSRELEKLGELRSSILAAAFNGDL